MSEHLPPAPFRKDTDEEYFASPSISASDIDHLRRSPAHFKAHREGKLKRDTAAIRLGGLIHRYLLQPETLDNAFHIKPEGMSFANREGKAWRADHADKPIIEAREWEAMKAVPHAIARDPAARQMFVDGWPELSCYVTDENGTERRSKFDFFSPAGNMLPDVKTTHDAREEAFQKTLYNLSMGVRAAFYLDNAKLAGYEKDHYVLVAVESTPPYNVVPWRIDPAVIRAGRAVYQKALQTYRDCAESGRWPGYDYGSPVPTISFPGWAQKELEPFL